MKELEKELDRMLSLFKQPEFEQKFKRYKRTSLDTALLIKQEGSFEGNNLSKKNNKANKRFA
jgi:hypothetical protein